MASQMSSELFIEVPNSNSATCSPISVTPNEFFDISKICYTEPPTATEPRGLVSRETLYICELILFVIITGSISLFGIFSNIINIIIFYKQGLTTTTNISFFALAVSDLFSVATLEWISICFNPLFIKSMSHWDARLVMYLTGAWPHLIFGRITCWITTYITAERCLCIALPLKVKRILTPKRTTIIISFLYFINFATMIPFYAVSYLDWIFLPEKNHTLLTMAVRENRSVMEPVAFVMYAVLGTTSFPLVILFTAILVYRLRRQIAWRMKSSNNQKQKATVSQREVQTMNVVMLIASVLIVCYTPGVIASLTASFVPSFNVVGSEVNIYYISWAIVSCCEALNSSVNIFIYYRMSSKYKQTFIDMFSWWGTASNEES